MLSFVEKHLSFYPKEKMSAHFLYFYLSEKELNQQVCLIKYVENEIFNSTFHKKREREREREEKHNPTSKKFLELLKIFSVVSLVTNYHKLSILLLAVRA